MGEMKTWVTPEVEVQTFQANEYVSLCVTGQPYGNGIDNFLGDLFNYYVEDGKGGYIQLGKLKGWSSSNSEIGFDATNNSGTLHTVYWKTVWGEYISSMYNLFEDKDGNLYVGNFNPVGNQTDANGNKAWS